MSRTRPVRSWPSTLVVKGLGRIRPVRQVSVAQVVQAHLLLDMLEAVQVCKRQAIDLLCGSTVIAEQVVAKPAASHGGFLLRARDGSGAGGSVVQPVGQPVRARHLSHLRWTCSHGRGRGTMLEGSPPDLHRPSPYRSGDGGGTNTGGRLLASWRPGTPIGTTRGSSGSGACPAIAMPT